MNKQFALVADGEIIAGPTVNPSDDARGIWLPVVDVDDKPLDPSRHWRLAPLPLRVDGDRVARTFPVVRQWCDGWQPDTYFDCRRNPVDHVKRFRLRATEQRAGGQQFVNNFQHRKRRRDGMVGVCGWLEAN